jgi:hypothetical protein
MIDTIEVSRYHVHGDLIMEKIEQKYELSFEWHKAAAGYKWEDCEVCDLWGEPFGKWERDKRDQFEQLVELVPVGPFLAEAHSTSRQIKWEPLENPMLFAEFADIKPDKESFLEWANGHGRLIDEGGALENYFFIYPKYTLLEESDYHCRAKADPLDFWLQEYRSLSFAVMLWEMTLNKDPRLSGLFEWKRNGGSITVYKIRKEALGKIDFEKFASDEDYRMDFGAVRDAVYDPDAETSPIPMTARCNGKLDPIKAASTYIQQEITRKLEEFH